MPYLTCTMISSVDLAHYGVSRIRDWVSVKYSTSSSYNMVCLPLLSDNPLALTSGLSLVLVVVVVVALLFYVHGKHLRSCRDGQLT